ncbi:hypothetical protein SAMN05444362_1161, partial [Dysgonomonas macrotermitis]
MSKKVAVIAPNHRLSTRRLATFHSGRFPSTRHRTVRTRLHVY